MNLSLPFLDIINPIMPVVLTWILTYGVHSTVILVLAWTVTRFLVGADQPVREHLWKTALLGGLLTATLQLATGVEPLSGRHIFTQHPSGNPDRIFQQLNARRLLPDGTAHHFGNIPPHLLMLHSPPAPAIQTNEELEESFISVSAHISAAPGSGRTTIPDSARYRVIRMQSHSRTVTASGNVLSGSGILGMTGKNRFGMLDNIGLLSIPAGNGPQWANMNGNIQHFPDASAHRNIATVRLYEWGWIQTLLLIWLTGVLWQISRWLPARRKLNRLLAGRKTLCDGPLPIIIKRLCREAGCRRRIKLTVSSRIDSPLAIGFREICIPERVLAELPPAQQETLLAHELAHLLRFDPLWLNLLTLMNTLFFFQPLNRPAGEYIAEISEYRCDDWAVRHTGRHLDLAKCLARVAEWCASGREVPPLAAMAGQRSALRRRVERILGHASAHSSRFARLSGAAILLVLLLVLGIAPTISARQDPAALLVLFNSSNITVQRAGIFHLKNQSHTFNTLIDIEQFKITFPDGGTASRITKKVRGI